MFDTQMDTKRGITPGRVVGVLAAAAAIAVIVFQYIHQSAHHIYH
jgi:hypothetical protein